MANVTTKHTSATLSSKSTVAASPKSSTNTPGGAVKPKDGGWAAIARGGSSSKTASSTASASTPASRSSVATTLPAKTNSAAAGSSTSNPGELKVTSFNSEEVDKYLQSKFQEYYKLAKDAKARHAEHEIAIFKPAESGWISNDNNHKRNTSKSTSTSSGTVPANGNPVGKTLTHTFLGEIAKSL